MAKRSPRKKKPAVSARAAAAPVRTVVYIHGIGNKPPEHELKCAWDHALFGMEMGERTRMAYWVDRARHPVPAPGTCRSTDTVHGGDGEAGVGGLALRPADAGEYIDRLTDNKAERQFLRDLVREIGEQARPPRLGRGAGKTAVKPLGVWTPVSWFVTKLFLREVHDYLFDQAKRERMERALMGRLEVGGGPFVVIGHSQGSMIAYNLLRRLRAAQCEVAQFVTIGSPLGLNSIEDRMKDLGGALRVPDCVGAWFNAAARGDIVSLDKDLADDYRANRGVAVEDATVVNPDAPEHPHSGTGYLKTQEVQRVVKHATGARFLQRIFDMSIAVDLNREATRQPQKRQEVLIELDSRTPLARDEAVRVVTAAVQRVSSTALVDVLQRYVVAELTRTEIERLRDVLPDLPVHRVWRDSEKRALSAVNGDAIQAMAGRVSYGATGANIRWAVLDTGIWGRHPHFETHKNIKGVFDSTVSGSVKEIAVADARDPDGHGTHVAAIIAGALALGAQKEGDRSLEMTGAAPEAALDLYKVLDDNGNGRDSWIIRALDHIAMRNGQGGSLVIHGVNLSLGGGFDPATVACGFSPICKELRRLWRQGVVVVIAAGNDGYVVLSREDGDFEANLDLSINDPANLDEAIAVGSVHKQKPHIYGVSWFSSRGPTADGRCKPDVVAPGERIVSAAALDRLPPKNAWSLDNLYVEMSGTSMAAPQVSGLLAAFLSAKPEFIGEPDKVKELLVRSCVDLGRDRYTQGAGLPSLMRMLALT